MKKLSIIFLLVLLLGCTAQPLPNAGGKPELPDSPRYQTLPGGLQVLLRESSPNNTVEFPDSNLESVIRSTLCSLGIELLASDPIEAQVLDSIVTLDAVNKNITDMTGIDKCLNLGYVILTRNNISNITPLSLLTGSTIMITDENGNKITYTGLALKLSGNPVNDLSPLAQLANLHLDGLSLFLRYCDIEDVAPLQNLTAMVSLDLAFNNIEDVSPLVGLKNLVQLDLQYNQIRDASCLGELQKNGTNVYLEGNPL